MCYKSNDSSITSCRINYNGIDVVKFICAFLVFFIHIPLLSPSVNGELTALEKSINFGLQKYIGRLAVPFFFTSSGFFLFSKMSTENLDGEKIKNYCFKILRLLGTWSVLLFIGVKDHLWYLGATVVAVTFISLCFKFRINQKCLLLIVCILYIFGLLGDSYHGLIEPITTGSVTKYLYAAWGMFFHPSRNGLFMGSIFILIGVYFSQNKVNIKLRNSVIGFVLSMAFLFVEVFTLNYYDIPFDNNMYVFLLPAVFFLFSIAYTIQLRDSGIYIRLRKIGVLVYFLHMAVNTFVVLGIKGVYRICGIDIKPYQCFIALASTLIISIILERLSHKKNFRWVNWLL